MKPPCCHIRILRELPREKTGESRQGACQRLIRFLDHRRSGDLVLRLPLQPGGFRLLDSSLFIESPQGKHRADVVFIRSKKAFESCGERCGIYEELGDVGESITEISSEKDLEELILKCILGLSVYGFGLIGLSSIRLKTSNESSNPPGKERYDSSFTEKILHDSLSYSTLIHKKRKMSDSKKVKSRQNLTPWTLLDRDESAI